MTSLQFIKDHQRGKTGQHFVAEMFRSWGANVKEVRDGFFQDWDLEINGKTVEVKYDLLAHQTGNLCLVLEALWHSKAQWLAIVTDNPRTVYLVPLQEALRFAERWSNKKEVGEFNVTAAIVPVQVLLLRTPLF